MSDFPDVLSDVTTDRIVDEAVGFQGPARAENTSTVTHPANAAPGHPALTNVGTVFDSDAGDPVGAVFQERPA